MTEWLIYSEHSVKVTWSAQNMGKKMWALALTVMLDYSGCSPRQKSPHVMCCYKVPKGIHLQKFSVVKSFHAQLCLNKPGLSSLPYSRAASQWEAQGDCFCSLFSATCRSKTDLQVGADHFGAHCTWGWAQRVTDSRTKDVALLKPHFISHWAFSDTFLAPGDSSQFSTMC